MKYSQVESNHVEWIGSETVFISIAEFISPEGIGVNFFTALTAAGGAICISFILTWILGFDDPQEDRV